MARNKLAIAITALILPLALSGCLRTNTDIYVGPEGDLGSAVVQVGIQKNVADKIGINNLNDFEEYITSTQKVLPEDGCIFGETHSEYTLDCLTPDIVDNEGSFTGITTRLEGGKLYLSARPNALTGDLSEYDANGEAVGSVMFYFDGEIESVDAPGSKYRIPSPGVVAFDLNNGKFFDGTAIVTVNPRPDYTIWYIGGVLLLLISGGGVYLYKRNQKTENPFISAVDKETPTPNKENGVDGNLMSGLDQKNQISQQNNSGEQTEK